MMYALRPARRGQTSVQAIPADGALPLLATGEASAGAKGSAEEAAMAWATVTRFGQGPAGCSVHRCHVAAKPLAPEFSIALTGATAQPSK